MYSLDEAFLIVDIEDDFKLHVKEFVSSVLSANNLIVKEINGSPITGRELVEYFKVLALVVLLLHHLYV